MDQIKQVGTVLKFKQTYELMKSYLSKKRFNYVYEQCIKYYNKNQSFLSNHEVLMLIKLVFYVLKKKMLSKTSPNLKNFSLQSVQQIYSIMTNIYLSWQNVLLVQMKSQNSQFFQMIFKNHSNSKINHSYLKPQNLLFQPKKDYIISGKLNIEYKIYNFLKQGLVMVINSMMVMVFSMNVDKIQAMTDMIVRSELIMNKFPQHLFPIQKIQFYLIKCQILQFIKQEQKQSHYHHIKPTQLTKNKQLFTDKIQIIYQFPIGLFSLIYKHIKCWKQAKINHYVKLLLKVVYYSVKNQLISIKDAYILASQIKILIYFTRLKDNKVSERKISMKGRRGILDSKSSLITDESLKKGKNTKQKNTVKSQNNHQSKTKIRFNNLLNITLNQIQNFIEQKKQIQTITRVYLEDVYFMYRNNSSHQNDEIVFQVPIIEKDNKKLRRSKSFQSPFKEKINLPLLKNQKNKKQSQQEEDHVHQSSILFYQQNSQIKQNQIILRNINNIKHNKKRLTLSTNARKQINLQKSSGIKQNNNISTSTTDSVVVDKQKEMIQNQKARNKYIFDRLIHKISNNAFESLNIFKEENISKPIIFLNQSSSDEQNQLEYEFQKKRRDQIRQINNKFYKSTNCNYKQQQNPDDQQTSNPGSDKTKQTLFKTQKLPYETYDIEQSNKIRKNKKISDDIQFDQIKLLDEVIKEKILNYLDMELNSLNYRNHKNTLLLGTNNIQSDDSEEQMITNYGTVMKKTQNLKQQVNQLNRQRKLLSDKFSYKSALLKNEQKYNPQQDDNQQFYSNVLKDLDNLYNTKNNLIQKGNKCITLYKKLLQIDQPSSLHPIFRNVVKKYGKIYKKYGQNLSVIGQIEQQIQNTTRKQQQIPIIEYIVQNRPISLLQKTLKIKQQQKKFTIHHKISQNEKKQIALRQNFDNLRGNICKSQFSQSNSLTKNFVLKKEKDQINF